MLPRSCIGSNDPCPLGRIPGICSSSKFPRFNHSFSHSFTHSLHTPSPKGPHFAAKVTRRGTARRPLDLLDGDSDDADWFGKNLEHLMDLSRVAGSTATNLPKTGSFVRLPARHSARGRHTLLYPHNRGKVALSGAEQSAPYTGSVPACCSE